MSTTRKDYLHDENFDLIIQNGDFKVGLSDMNHLASLLTLSNGHIRYNTELGAGVFKEINGHYDIRTRHSIISSISKDGYTSSTIKFEGDNIIIEI